MRTHLLTGLAVIALAYAPGVAGQGPPAPQQSAPAQAAQTADPSADLMRQAQQQMRQGNEDQAIALGRRAVQSSPGSFQLNSQMGALLDLAGHYKEAREYLAKAAELAPAAQKARAQRAIAISYGFEQDCAGVTKYEEPIYRQYLEAKDFYNAGEVANELARLCLDAGNLDEAYRWYHNGYEAGLREPGIGAERTDLWNYRWEHAQARIAARRGNAAEAQKHVDAAKALLERGNMPQDQKQYFPYLVGYVALHGGQHDAALAQLQQGNQSDPYVLGLIAQTYEKLGKQDAAMEYYRKVMAATVHNPTAAGSRPLARRKLAK